LDIPEVRVLNAELNPRGDCTITVESTREGTRCRKCGREIKDFHGVDEWITLRHLPILGRRVYLRLRPKRYRCPYCEGGPTLGSVQVERADNGVKQSDTDPYEIPLWERRDRR
jgi:transposase